MITMAMGEGDEFSTDRETAASVANTVFKLSADIGIPQSLKDLNIPEEKIPEMAEGAMKVAVPMANNPRPMTISVVEDIYRKAFEGR